MKVQGTVELRHCSETIWSSLTDPEIMQQSIPGCNLFEEVCEAQYQADIGFKVSLLSINFTVSLDIIEATENEYYLFNASGNGGIAGDAKGSCSIRLADQTQGSLLTYDATVQLEGMLQKVAEPLIRKKAQKLIEKYFTRFEKAIDTCNP